MNQQVNLTMFNPFDAATFGTGSLLMTAFGIIYGSSPVLATAVGAIITGIFVLLAKVLELCWKSYQENKRGKQKNRKP